MALRSRLPSRPPRVAADTSIAIINIVLLLVFYFLATGSLLTAQQIPIELPETYELPLEHLPKPILIVGEDGSLSLNGEPVTSSTLAEKVIDEPILHVLANREGNAGVLLQLLADAKLIAVEIRLVTVHRTGGGAGS